MNEDEKLHQNLEVAMRENGNEETPVIFRLGKREYFVARSYLRVVDPTLLAVMLEVDTNETL